MQFSTRVIRKTNKKNIAKKYEKSAIELIFRATNLVRNEAITSINQNPRKGKTVTRRGKVMRISAVGDPPATDTGFLASNIINEFDSDKLGASVISRAKYSIDLEFGTSKMGARPFMQPALEKNKPKIRRLQKQLIKL